MEDFTKVDTPENIPFILHSASVVVTADSHNPSILNPYFLEANGIVPSSWEVVETITTAPVSMVNYNNGIHWTVDHSRLSVTENCKSSFKDDYLVYDLAKAYLKKLPHVPYRSLGLNCVVSVKQVDPEQWITHRFLKSGPWFEDGPKVIHMMPSFALDAGDAVCILKFETRQFTSSRGEPQTAVIVNSNIHHSGPLDLNKLLMAIDRWPEKQNFVTSALSMLWQQPQK